MAILAVVFIIMIMTPTMKTIELRISSINMRMITFTSNSILISKTFNL